MTPTLEPTLEDKTLEAVERVLLTRKLEFYVPYPKQAAFHRAGGDADVRERLLMAGNQLGKTWSAGFEVAMHATGMYPDWWEGVRFEKPVVAWVGSPTGQTTRDNPQRILMGRIGDWGSGSIPKNMMGEIKRGQGVPDAVETVMVKHVSGGWSQITFKSYDQGRLRWQGETLNFVWFDEEPPEDIYSEGLTRTNATFGIVFLTFTPLLGMSKVVMRFLIEKPAGTHVTNMTIEDALHYTPEQRIAIVAAYPEHEREARAKGIPIMGSGRVFPIAEERVMELPVHIPPHWPRICGLDFGYDHPTAAAWLAWDPDTDVVHVYDAYRVREATPVIHGAALKSRGVWIPVAWPHDGLQHDKGGSCEVLAQQYRDQGVAMLKDKASHPPQAGKPEGHGGNGREAGVIMMLDRMQTGRLRVARHLHDWWEEFRLYHRKDGKIVMVNDDLMSATRYALMMLRFAKINQNMNAAMVRPFRPTDPTMGVLG